MSSKPAERWLDHLRKKKKKEKTHIKNTDTDHLTILLEGKKQNLAVFPCSSISPLKIKKKKILKEQIINPYIPEAQTKEFGF